ncbi:hypothetical protein Esi_0113_0044 [Ectocarpus siliculosus]|uniref:Uncharacterized protein n=1 Tax=Ectocarpus siliculosus TaxID=2880 RepID=D8LD40_ECTSI|nr:hypothetical protein Esi_0113_0044 [Ectocarpus siliculosus]|eukprot:CBN78407.1 hypothetical protein Esi_0113_0044 [Ectocarpus siliculosus]
MVSKPLVTMVPRVPGPLQPLMDKVHPIMIKERRPMRWLGVEALDTVTNAGALCGHLSFAILTLAYLETDVLKLRSPHVHARRSGVTALPADHC